MSSTQIINGQKMTLYILSNTSTNFVSYLTDNGVKNEVSEDGKCILVWLGCDTDLLILGQMWEKRRQQLESNALY